MEKRQRGMEGDYFVADLQVAKTALESLKSDYLCLCLNRDYILKVAEINAKQLRGKRMRLISSIGSLMLLRRHWLIHGLLFMKQKIRLLPPTNPGNRRS